MRTLPPAPQRHVLCMLLCLPLALALGCAGKSKPPPPPPMEQPSPAVFQQMDVALDILEDVPGEPFRSFLPRARAALLSADDARMRNIGRNLPDQPFLYIGGYQRGFLPVLLARWAKGRARLERAGLLRDLVQADTEWRLGTDPKSPRLLDQEAQLRSAAVRKGLKFSTDDLYYEVGPHGATRDKNPNVKGLVTLFVRGDVAQPIELARRPHDAGATVGTRIYGPRASSDRAALVAGLVAVSALKESGVPLVASPTLVVDRFGNLDGRGTRHFLTTRGVPKRSFALDGHFPLSTTSPGTVAVTLRSQDGAAPSTDGAQLVFASAEAPDEEVPRVAQATFLVDDAERAQQKLQFALSGSSSHPGVEVLYAPLAKDLLSVTITTRGGPLWSTFPDDNALRLLGTMQRNAFGADTPCEHLLASTHEAVVVDEMAPLNQVVVRPSHFALDERGHCEASFAGRLSPGRSFAEKAAAASREQGLADAKRRSVLRDQRRAKRAKEAGKPTPKKLRTLPPKFQPIQVEPTKAWHKTLEAAFDARLPNTGKSSVTVEWTAPSAIGHHQAVEDATRGATQVVYGKTLAQHDVTQPSVRPSLARMIPDGAAFGPLLAGDGNSQARLFSADDHIDSRDLDDLVEAYTFALTKLCR